MSCLMALARILGRQQSAFMTPVQPILQTNVVIQTDRYSNVVLSGGTGHCIGKEASGIHDTSVEPILKTDVDIEENQHSNVVLDGTSSSI